MVLIIRLGVILGLAILLAATNPGMTEFEQFVEEQVQQEARQSRSGPFLMITRAMGIDQMAVDRIMANTQHQDYIVISIFEIDIDDQPPARFLGAANSFFPLSGSR